ncbi:MAG: hypothetical protein HYX69_18320 [Planctomycetia bacterium]|nr:hypothetical protein [Planctomycetia bacterium]
MVVTAPPQRKFFRHFLHGGVANRGIRPRIAASFIILVGIGLGGLIILSAAAFLWIAPMFRH